MVTNTNKQENSKNSLTSVCVCVCVRVVNDFTYVCEEMHRNVNKYNHENN